MNSFNLSRIYLRLFPWLLVLFSGGVYAEGLFDRLSGSVDSPLDVEQAYIFSGVETGAGVYQLRWEIEDGYYLYKDKIKVITTDKVEHLDSRYAEAEPKEDPLFGNVLVYYNQAEVVINLKSTMDRPVNEVVKIQYQGCWDGGICYPPVTKELVVNQVPVKPDGLAPMRASVIAPAGINAATTEAVVSDFSLTDQTQFSQVLAGGNLFLILSAFLLAGLALSLTPCVFPMIPILAGVIAGQKNSTPQRAFAMSVIYVLSMAVTYTLAGVFAGLFGENLQAAFQNPWVISIFSLMFVVFAGSMFGFFQLEMPQGIQNSLNRLSRSQQGGEVAGVVVMGFLSALIVGPCVAAPLASALIFIGQTGDPVLGGVALFILSIGMGLPLILVGTSAGKLLPKAGSWMNGVKSAFGVVMLLMAVWMLDRIVPTAVTMVLAGVILVVTAIYLKALDGLTDTASGLQRFGKGVGILLLIYGGALLIGAAGGNRSVVYPLKGFAGGGQAQASLPQFTKVTSYRALEPLLAQAQLDNKPVMLDFYADWCVSCQELEFYTFADAAAQQQMSRFSLIKVDVTANDADAKELYQRYQIVGPPALVFYDPNGKLQKKMLIGVPSPRDFAAHLERI
ncbi:protein-disulfide reductase DsbD [Motiliproteus sp. MSK22-1]|uniref:protein-disulfide reductase DsbD n=1 Tax=Motiliproteus sp. MSK22-1 TaxID=1897630 RepID=UPI0009761F2C|nr:protein-disulfide reductase DsbD [Motiliproteus sp. MSK22-1]OMH32647.1 protein-disulfide reductase [Motiliproteus sp. MSK22-1]